MLSVVTYITDHFVYTKFKLSDVTKLYLNDVYNNSNSTLFNPCSYAAMVETETFSFSSDFITTTRFNDTDDGRKPLVLDWVVGNATCEVARDMPSYACHSRNSMCVNSTNGQGYLCNCTDGYEGNPYLFDGCRGKFISLLDPCSSLDHVQSFYEE